MSNSNDNPTPKIDIINLQKYDVVVMPKGNLEPITFPSSGEVQVRMKTEDLTPNGIVKDGTWTHTRSLPVPSPGRLYIVGALVAMFELYHNDRTDLLFPWQLVRGRDGSVIGCRALVRPKK